MSAVEPEADPGSAPVTSSIGVASFRSTAENSAGWAAVAVDQVIACRWTAGLGLREAGTGSAVEAA
jgi:hypothetical protein